MIGNYRYGYARREFAQALQAATGFIARFKDGAAQYDGEAACFHLLPVAAVAQIIRDTERFNYIPRQLENPQKLLPRFYGAAEKNFSGFSSGRAITATWSLSIF